MCITQHEQNIFFSFFVEHHIYLCQYGENNLLDICTVDSCCYYRKQCLGKALDKTSCPSARETEATGTKAALHSMQTVVGFSVPSAVGTAFSGLLQSLLYLSHYRTILYKSCCFQAPGYFKAFAVPHQAMPCDFTPFPLTVKNAL